MIPLPPLEQAQAALYRADLLSYVEAVTPGYQAGWVHREICERLEAFSRAVIAGESPRLMLFMPPRHGKSLLSSVVFPVWHLGHYPSHEIIMATYGQDLSNDFSVKARRLVNADATRLAFPELELSRERKKVQAWQTSREGAYQAIGVGGGATGKGAHIAVIDDVIKDPTQAHSPAYLASLWEWYRSVLYTRLAPQSGILLLQTRWAAGDLAGQLLDEAERGGDRWEVINYPAVAEEDEAYRRKGEALHPARYPIEALRRMEPAVGPYVWSALYQQRPAPAEGAIFKREWVRHWSNIPTRRQPPILSVDCAFKGSSSSDYVTIQVWVDAGPDLYLLDQARGQWGFTETLGVLRQMAGLWQPRAVLIEDKANGPAVIDVLRDEIPGVIPVNPDGSKEARAHAVTALWQAGNVYLPPLHVAWVGDYLDEVLHFPHGRNDDQVDSTTQALRYLTQRDGADWIFQLTGVQR